MGDTYSAVEIRSTLQTFQGYLRDLIESKFDTFGTKLRLFVNFCEMDDTFRVIARNLHERSGDVREWFAESTRGPKALPLPADPVRRLAHQYKVLLDLKQQRIELRNFLSSLFKGGSIEEAHGRFRKEWLESLRASFEAVFARIEASLAGKERVELESLVSGALESGPAPAPVKPPPAAPAAAPAAAAAAAPPVSGKGGKAKKAAPVDLGGLVKALEKSVKGSKALAVKVKSDLETDVKILKLELSKNAPNLAIVRTIADTLTRRAGEIGTLAGQIISRSAGPAGE